MPSESVGNYSFRDLFNQNICFEVPFFQRGYAWEKKQWETLFLDIEEQILNEADDIDEVKNYELYFGSIVVLEKPDQNSNIKRFIIIDGQQRITTVYLLLAIIKNQIKKKTSQSTNAISHINDLINLIENKNTNAGEYDRMKIYSSKGDRLPTYNIIFGQNPNNVLYSDIQLYIKGENNVDKLKEYLEKKLKDEKYNSVPGLWKLCIALLDSLKIVWIPLKENDDPQAIFESLNDKGMPLNATELLCNYIFKPIIDAKEDYEKLHNEKWLYTQKNIEGGQKGFEQYLRILFSIGNKKTIGTGRVVYTFFKNSNRHLSVLQAKTTIENISNISPEFNTLVNPIERNHRVAEITNLLIMINSTRMEGCYTFLLAVLKAFKENELTQEEAINLLKETLVFLVRRKYGEMKTQKYDTIFPGLFNKIIGETNKIAQMHKIIRADDYWVSDQEFADFIVERPLYRTRDLPFTNMILQEVDKKLEVYDQYPDFSRLNTVEHILPQTLDNDWKVYLGDEIYNDDLARYTDTIGNLCLLSQPANSHAGQDPFINKIIDYPDVSALTRDIKNRKDKKWNIKSINERSIFFKEKLLELFSWKQ
jgi:hypothetical protein